MHSALRVPVECLREGYSLAVVSESCRNHTHRLSTIPVCQGAVPSIRWFGHILPVRIMDSLSVIPRLSSLKDFGSRVALWRYA